MEAKINNPAFVEELKAYHAAKTPDMKISKFMFSASEGDLAGLSAEQIAEAKRLREVYFRGVAIREAMDANRDGTVDAFKDAIKAAVEAVNDDEDMY